MRRRIEEDKYDLSAHRAALFLAKVKKTDGCWIWQGYVSPDGYGKFGGGTKTEKGNIRLVLAHVYSWLLFGGHLEPPKEVDHTCFNRACVNPQHLELVTPSVNTTRMHKKNFKVRCDRGHNNWRVKTNGKRVCKTCDYDSCKRHRARKKLQNA